MIQQSQKSSSNIERNDRDNIRFREEFDNNQEVDNDEKMKHLEK